MKIQQREFWTPSGPPAPPLAEAHAPKAVILTDNVRRFLRRQLSSPARARGGLLFGYPDGEHLHVLLASSAGSPEWYERSAHTREILEVDSRFAVGWSEALFELLGGRIDWIGNWLAYPDGHLRSEKRDLRRFREGVKLGLIDDRSVLLIVAWEDRATAKSASGLETPSICELWGRGVNFSVPQIGRKILGSPYPPWQVETEK